MGKSDVTATVIEDDAMRAIACPHCNHPLENSGKLAGWEVACPSCGCRFRMPSAFDSDVGAQRVRRRLHRRSPLNVQVAMLTATGITVLGLPLLAAVFGLHVAILATGVYLLVLIMLFVVWFAGR